MTRRAKLQAALDAFGSIEEAREALRSYTAQGNSGIDGAVQFLLDAATGEPETSEVDALKARIVEFVQSL